MASKIRYQKDWIIMQEALLDIYVETVFETDNVDDWFVAAHWYIDATFTQPVKKASLEMRHAA